MLMCRGYKHFQEQMVSSNIFLGPKCIFIAGFIKTTKSQVCFLHLCLHLNVEIKYFLLVLTTSVGVRQLEEKAH